MTAPYNFDAIWQYLPYEPVTLYRRQDDDTFDDGTMIPHAVLVNLSKVPSANNPRVLRRVAQWALCQDEANNQGAEPDPTKFDCIQRADGTRWEIDHVTISPLGVAYEIESVEEVP